MNAFDELVEGLLACEDDSHREKLQQAIRTQARRSVPELVSWLQARDLDNVEDGFRLAEMIEALGPVSAEFSGILLPLLDQLLGACRRAPSRGATFALGSFAFAEEGWSPALRTALRQRYLRALRGAPLAVRVRLVDLLAGFEIEGDVAARDALRKLLQDPDWRVRWEAERALRTSSALPTGYRSTLLNRLRRLILRRE